MKLILLLFTLFFFQNNCFPQWTIIPSNTINDFYSVSFIDENTGWIVGDSGSIYISTNGGTKWDKQTTNITEALYSVAFLNKDKGIAGGYRGACLITTNGGKNWNKKLVPNNINIYDISIIDSNNIVVVGYDIYKSTDWGNSWNKITYLNSRIYVAVHFWNTENGIVAGWGTTSYLTTNGGLVWNESHLGGDYFYDMEIVNKNTCWIIGSFQIDRHVPPECYTYKSTNKGVSWVKQVLDYANIVNVIEFCDSLNGIIFSHYNDKYYITTDGGKIWTTKNYKLTSKGINGASFISFNNVIAVGDNGLILKNSKALLTENENNTRTDFSLLQNFPNPFNSSTTIKFNLSKSDNVSLNIYDALGRELETLINEKKSSGVYEVQWNAESLPSGIYFYRLQTSSGIINKKMTLLK